MNDKPVFWACGLEEDEAVSNALKIKLGLEYYNIPLYTHPSDRISELEQQLKEEIQARADALDDLNNRMMRFMKSYNEMAWKLEEVGGAYTHPVKELTNEEIIALWYAPTSKYNPILFARAILRKAQEK